jgi:uncharacterized protein with HEPN domain
MPLRPDVFLETALLALRRVAKFMGNRSLSDYLADELCQSALQRSLRGLGVLTQRLPRGPRGANEPRAIAKPAGRDGDGS